MKGNIVISGSGMSALMLARMIKKYRDTGAAITIVERDAVIGGQFGSINYGEHGYFDYGMHIYYESCVPEIDELFTSILPEKEWNILVENLKDAAGLFVNGKLQVLTPYIDVRNLPEAKKKEYIAELLLHIEHMKDKKLKEDPTAYDILQHHFGDKIVDEIFVPVLEKLYKTHPAQLDEIATQLTTINRLAMFDEEMMLKLMKVDEIRARICFPNQYTMPPFRTVPQRGFYPKKYGMFRVLEKLKSMLEAEGVRFLTSSTISEVKLDGNKVSSIVVAGKDGQEEIGNLEKLYWSAGLPPLANALKLDLSGFTYDKQVNTAYYVNFLFDKKPEMDQLYYFYCFDKGYRTFRVTNYTNYCPAANEGRGYPVCVELWANAGDPDQEPELIALAQKELKAFGVIDDTYKVQFAKADKVHGGGFPLPTVKNVNNMNTIREMITERGIKNLVPIGVYASKNVFFIKDVLMDTYKKVIANN
jgi:protoporphyrinogen oxidase